MSSISQRVVKIIGELFNKYKDNDVVQAKEYNANYDSIKDVVNNNAEATKELQKAVRDLTEGIVPDYSISNDKLQAACVSYNNLNANLVNDVLMHKNNINSMLNPFAEGLYRYTTVSGNLYNSHIYRTLEAPSNAKNVTYTYETAGSIVGKASFYRVYFYPHSSEHVDSYEANFAYQATDPFTWRLYAKSTGNQLYPIHKILNFSYNYTITYNLHTAITAFTLSIPRIYEEDAQTYGTATLTFFDGTTVDVDETTDYNYTTDVSKTLIKVELKYGGTDDYLYPQNTNVVPVSEPTFTLREVTNVSATTTIGPCSLSNPKNKLKVMYKLKKNEGAPEELSNTPGVISYTTSKYNEVTSVWEPYTYTATNYIYEAAPDESGSKVCYYTAYLELPSGTNFPNTITLDYTNDNLVTLLTCLVSALDGPQRHDVVDNGAS